MSTTCFGTKMRDSRADWSFKLPLKRLLAARYGQGDGSCSGRAVMTPAPAEIMWLEGAIAVLRERSDDVSAAAELQGMVDALRAGYSIELVWR